jgi:hypothetical protein
METYSLTSRRTYEIDRGGVSLNVLAPLSEDDYVTHFISPRSIDDRFISRTILLGNDVYGSLSKQRATQVPTKQTCRIQA